MNEQTQFNVAVKDVEQRAELDVIISLVTLAFINRDVIDTSVDFSSHANCLSVAAVKRGDFIKYNFENVPRVVHGRVFLGEEYYVNFDGSKSNPLDKLLALEDTLIDAIATARDEAEAEVQA